MKQIEIIRIFALSKKEIIQIKRDMVTFTWLFMIPIVQLFLFGYIINTNPKHLPTAVIAHENTQFTRNLLEGFKHTDYFSLDFIPTSEAEGHQLLQRGNAQFLINIPPHFSRDLIRGQSPHVLIEADASDPIAVINAFYAATVLPSRFNSRELHGPLNFLKQTPAPFVLDVQRKYNPESIPQYNTLPGLIALLLFTTLTILTAISITEERESGTYETLLATPLTQLNIIIGKVIPHFILGYLILFILLGIAMFYFQIPFHGNIFLYLVLAIPYCLASLGTGLVISAFSRTQFQAVGTANFYLLVAMIISGFIFPFKGMPGWAQKISEVLPLTHFLRITRSSMLKGADFNILWPDTWPIIIFMIFILILSMLVFKRTLD